MTETTITKIEPIYHSESLDDQYYLFRNTHRVFNIADWMVLNFPQLQNCVEPDCTIYHYNVVAIVKITYSNGENAVMCRYKTIFRGDGICYPFPCIHERDYDSVLPVLLKHFNQQFWSLSSHEDLSHFKTTKSFQDCSETNFDDMVSPCQQIVMATLLCNEYFGERLPCYVIANILSFLPQELFRLGDVVNCYPGDEVLGQEFLDQFQDDFQDDF